MKEEEREGEGKEGKTAQLSSAFHFCEKSVLSVANKMEPGPFQRKPLVSSSNIWYESGTVIFQ